MTTESVFVPVYLPDVSALRAGDIVLTRNREGEATNVKSSSVIVKVTGGTFSHALICTSPPTLMEALPGGGVSTLSLARSFAYSREAIRVLRHPDAAIAAEAARRVQLELGRGYSISKAALSVTGLAPAPSDRGVFCSALVAQAFVEAGAPEFEHTPPDRTTPATLEHLHGLQDVTDSVFRAAVPPRNVETLVALDGDRVASPSLRQSEISASYARRLIPIVDAIQRDFARTPRKRVATLNDCMEFLLNAYDVADEGDFDAAALLGRLQILDALAADLLGSGELSALYEDLREIDRTMFESARDESHKPDPDIDAVALRGLYEASQAELPLRIEALAHYQANSYRSRTAGAWVSIQVQVNSGITERNCLIAEILAHIRS